jgi:hypothetical protein
VGCEHEALRLRLQTYVASSPPMAWDRARCLEQLDLLLAEAKRLGEPWALFDAMRAKAHVLGQPSPESLALHAELVALARSQNSLLMASEAHLLHHHVLLMVGHMEEARASLDSLREVAAKLSLMTLRFSCERLVLAADLRLAQIEPARARFAALMRDAETRGLRYTDVLQWRCELEFASAEGPARRSAEPAACPPIIDEFPEFLATQARCLAEQQRLEEARQLLERLSPGGFRALRPNYTLPASLANLSLAAVAVQDRERADQLYELLRPHQHLFAVDVLGFSLGSVQQFLGELAALLGRPAHARQHLESARAENRRTDHRTALLRSERSLAELAPALQS